MITGDVTWRVFIDNTGYPALVDQVLGIDQQTFRRSTGASPIPGDACASLRDYGIPHGAMFPRVDQRSE